MSVGLLSDVRVIEVAGATTEYAGKALAAIGAEVWLVEPPAGAPTRDRRPFAETAERSRRSIPFLARNVDKRSVVIDSATDSGRARFRALASGAQIVLLPDGSPFELVIADLDGPVQVTVRDPDGVGASSVTAFAASGGLSSSGWPDGVPCNAPSWLAHDAAAVYAAVFALVGLYIARDGAVAPRFEVPLREAGIAGLVPWTRALQSAGLVTAAGAAGTRRGPFLHPYLPTADGGYVRVLTATPGQWEALVALLGHPEALATEQWRDRTFRSQNVDALMTVASEFSREFTRDHLFHEGQRLGSTITPVQSPAEVMADEHGRARALFVEVADPDLGVVPILRAPLRLPRERIERAPRPAPALDADAEAAAAPSAAAGTTRTGVRARPAGADPPALPFGDLRVLNFGVGAVVPELASLLALLGADVIKVESKKRLEFMRMASTNESAPFNQGSMGVRSLAVDMNDADGREVVRALVPSCDLVVQNMRPGVLDRWGFDYDSVRALRPDVIYLSSSGVGIDGPFAAYQNYGPNLQTFSGLTSLWAHPSDPFAVGTSLNHPDHIAGKHSLLPVLAALLRRERTGEGALIDAAQYEVSADLIAEQFLLEAYGPGSACALGNRSRDVAPHGVYPCAGADAWIALAVVDD
ncbi:MAG: CoA transferase, partial [Chloroflexi bacterium]|nr:CoA transferase [Chloroflexota bacterium]